MRPDGYHFTADASFWIAQRILRRLVADGTVPAATGASPTSNH
jgi:hypothetical protein